jgi:ABC-type multidrug transport system ATPase subunit
MSIIYTTHYMEEAERLCDRVAIVDHGKIIALGTNAELVRRTHSARAARCWRALREPKSESLHGSRSTAAKRSMALRNSRSNVRPRLPVCLKTAAKAARTARRVAAQARIWSLFSCT